MLIPNTKKELRDAKFIERPNTKAVNEWELLLSNDGSINKYLHALRILIVAMWSLNSYNKMIKSALDTKDKSCSLIRIEGVVKAKYHHLHLTN